MTDLITLFYQFFKVGLFTIGGGLAALPLLENELVTTGILSRDMFTNMIAVSQSTPGPIGINMATYIGYTQMGILGSIVATLGMVAPSLIIITIIAKLLIHFNELKCVKGMFIGIRPAVVGVIGVVFFNIARGSITGLWTLLILISLLILTRVKNIGPVAVIGTSALLGGIFL